MQEQLAAETPLEKLSETSDVYFTIHRARYDGCTMGPLPPGTKGNLILVYAYMVAKFTLRWSFYRTVGFLCTAPWSRPVREVVNPSKDEKLGKVAARHQIDPVKFKRVGGRVRRVWPLLP